MASLCKATRGVSGNLFDHYERKENIKFKNQDIDKTRSYLNYNLGQFTRNYTQTVKRAADNKRRYAPGEGSIPPVLLSGVSKGVLPFLISFLSPTIIEIGVKPF